MIDIKNWKRFRIGDLFNIHPTKAYKLTNAKLLDGGSNPVVANSAYNNGIGGYSTQKPTEKGNMVTFSDTVDANTIFYQSKDFIGYPHVQGLYPTQYVNNWNKYTYQFFISVFRKIAITKGFDYGNKFRRDIASNLIVKLPITMDEHPDWVYMESYMKKIMEESEKSLKNLKKSNCYNHLINTKSWNEFRIGDYFNIYLSKDDIQPKKHIVKGNIPLISSGKTNNGIATYIKDDYAKLWDDGTITVDMFGKAFYQNKPYYCVSHGRVNILQAKFNMSEKVALFVISAIERISSKYEFKEMCTGTKLSNDIIKLPATLNGQPDWEYMENYMKKVMKKSEQSISALRAVV